MPERRRIREGDIFTINEENREQLEFETPDPDPNPPPEETRGEPWGWRKDGPRPRGWPGPDHPRDEPGPYDGEWEPPRDDA
jgi:hypothetical protein